jgi:hypothetical protein
MSSNYRASISINNPAMERMPSEDDADPASGAGEERSGSISGRADPSKQHMADVEHYVGRTGRLPLLVHNKTK